MSLPEFSIHRPVTVLMARLIAPVPEDIKTCVAPAVHRSVVFNRAPRVPSGD
jgi:hypothetical protein